ncbi:hypothetical protein GCM10010462_12380 [Microbacterium dextranolyticum]|uniref:Uncharacterized protein n=1 Tax=Microbacterium dextranolyticum TaxID=36806 RepID=A0A9W6HJR0_9MICO|nr:hypothetical protein GCM10017591_00850 [Microbacterium dextranolyticum]
MKGDTERSCSHAGLRWVAVGMSRKLLLRDARSDTSWDMPRRKGDMACRKWDMLCDQGGRAVGWQGQAAVGPSGSRMSRKLLFLGA